MDIGGTWSYWHNLDFKYKSNVHITLLNIDVPDVPDNVENMVGVGGNATHMSDFYDEEFDIVFSNSCIEHVGQLDEWKKMAEEVKRCGKHFFIQTPNKYFPIEPHFVFPFF